MEDRVGTCWGQSLHRLIAAPAGQAGACSGPGEKTVSTPSLTTHLLFAQGSWALMTWLLLGSLNGLSAISGIP